MKFKIDTKTSNWCTMWPDRWINYDYSVCCMIHDEDYADPSVSRWEADVRLLVCVEKNANSLMAVTMFLGVRLIGWMFKHYTPKIK